MSPIIEEVFLRCFGSPQRLCEYINSDTDLAKYVKGKYRAYISLIWLCLGSKAAILEEVKQITPKDVHDLLRRRRPDLPSDQPRRGRTADAQPLQR